MATGSVLQESVSKFIVCLDTSKPSHVWRYFGTLVYTEDGKRRTAHNHYFCKECLDRAIATDEEAPFEKYVLLPFLTVGCFISLYFQVQNQTLCKVYCHVQSVGAFEG